GRMESWVGTATDIDDQKRTEQAQDFLLRAGAELHATLDYRAALRGVARLAVPEIADWCVIDLVDNEERPVPLALAHADPAEGACARERQERYPGGPDVEVAASVIRRREPVLATEISDDALAAAAADELHLDLMRELRLRSFMCVPVISGDSVAAAITFA